MKTIKHLLLAILPLVAISLTGCGKDGGTENGGGNGGGGTTTDFDLKLELAKAGETSLEVLCTPNDETTPYLVFAIEKSAYTNDTEMVSSKLSSLEFEARLDGKKFEDYIASLQNTGTKTVAIDELTADTTYYVYAYANKADGSVVGDIFMREYKTSAKAPFTIELSATNVTDMTADLSITPNYSTETYFCNYMTAASYEAIGDTQIIDAYIAYIKQNYNGQFSKLIISGNKSLTADNLVPNTKYVFFAFGLDSNGNATSKLSRIDFTTKEFVPTDTCTFTLSTSDATATSMTVNVTPSNAATRYYVGIISAEGAKEYTLDELASEFIASEENYDIDWATTKYVFTGTKSLDVINDLGYNPLVASTEYTIVVFGINTKGVRTTTVATVNGSTTAPAQSSMTLDMADSNITMNGATITVTPSVAGEKYFANLMPYDTFATAKDDAEIVASIVEQLGSNMSQYLVSGTTKFNYEYQLVSNTKYVAYAFGYDGGATTKVFTHEFTTSETPAGVIDAAVGFDYIVADAADLGYTQYAGRPLLYAVMSPNAHAASWYYVFTDEDITDKSKYDDATLAQALKTNGTANENRLLSLAGDWNTTVYFAIVAFDSNGTAGVPQRYTIEVKKASTQTSALELSSVKRMLTVDKIKTQMPALKSTGNRKAVGFKADKTKLHIFNK